MSNKQKRLLILTSLIYNYMYMMIISFFKVNMMCGKKDINRGNY